MSWILKELFVYLFDVLKKNLHLYFLKLVITILPSIKTTQSVRLVRHIGITKCNKNDIATIMFNYTLFYYFSRNCHEIFKEKWDSLRERSYDVISKTCQNQSKFNFLLFGQI